MLFLQFLLGFLLLFGQRHFSNGQTTRPIWDILSNNPSASAFTKSLEEANLRQAMSTAACMGTATSPCFTILVPPNDLWTAALVDPIKWSSLSILDKQAVIFGMVIDEVVAGSGTIRLTFLRWTNFGNDINLYDIGFGRGKSFHGRTGRIATFQKTIGGTVYYFANQARVTGGNIEATNGVVHYIDRPIYSPAISQMFMDYIKTRDDIKITLRLWNKLITDPSQAYYHFPGQVWLNNPFYVTIFVVSDSGWNKVPAATLKEIENNSTELARILGCTYAPNQLFYKEWADVASPVDIKIGFPDDPVNFSAEQMKTATISKAGTETQISVVGTVANIVGSSISIKRGSVMTIDQPLGFVYENSQTVVQRISPAFASACQAVTSCNNALTSQSAYTIFALTNDAMAKLNSQPQAQKEMYINLLTMTGRLTSSEMTPTRTLNINGVENAIRFRKINNEIYVEGRLPAKGYVAARVQTANQQTTNGLIHVLEAVPGLPVQTVSEYVTSRSEFSQFAATNFIDSLTAGGPYTYIVPDNTGMQQMRSSSLDGLVILQSAERTRYVLRRMTIPRNVILEDLLVNQNYRVATANYAYTRETISLLLKAAQPYRTASLTHSGVVSTILSSDGGFQCTDGIIYKTSRILYTLDDVTNKMCTAPACPANGSIPI